MKSKYIILLLISILALSSCKNKKEEKVSYLKPPSIVYTEKDTLQIMDEVRQYVDLFANHQYEECAELLYEVHNDSIFPLTAEKQKSFVKGMNFLNIKDVKVSNLKLRSDKNNQVCITCLLKEDGDIDKGIGVTTFYLNPVLIDNKWYLTILDENAEGVERIY